MHKRMSTPQTANETERQADRQTWQLLLERRLIGLQRTADRCVLCADCVQPRELRQFAVRFALAHELHRHVKRALRTAAVLRHQIQRLTLLCNRKISTSAQRMKQHVPTPHNTHTQRTNLELHTSREWQSSLNAPPTRATGE
jgi:hypothetical protein